MKNKEKMLLRRYSTIGIWYLLMVAAAADLRAGFRLWFLCVSTCARASLAVWRAGGTDAASLCGGLDSLPRLSQRGAGRMG